MAFLVEDFRARWLANERRFDANRRASFPSPYEHAECERARGRMCREIVNRLAELFVDEQVPHDLAVLIDAARLVGRAEPEHAGLISVAERLAGQWEPTQ